MKILSIDPGFERMGVAIIERAVGSAKPRVLYSACVKTSPKDAFHLRIKALGDALQEIIAKHQPGVLAIEKLFFSNNQQTALAVAEARGVAVYEAARHGLSFFEYTPIQIKLAVAGYGRATKSQVIVMTQTLAEFEDTEKKVRGKARSDDEFDAIAVGLTHFAYSKPFSKNRIMNNE